MGMPKSKVAWPHVFEVANKLNSSTDQQMSNNDPILVDEATLIEERRKRREAIKAKYKGQVTPSFQAQQDTGCVKSRYHLPMLNHINSG